MKPLAQEASGAKSASTRAQLFGLLLLVTLMLSLGHVRLAHMAETATVQDFRQDVRGEATGGMPPCGPGVGTPCTPNPSTTDDHASFRPSRARVDALRAASKSVGRVHQAEHLQELAQLDKGGALEILDLGPRGAEASPEPPPERPVDARQQAALEDVLSQAKVHEESLANRTANDLSGYNRTAWLERRAARRATREKEQEEHARAEAGTPMPRDTRTIGIQAADLRRELQQDAEGLAVPTTEFVLKYVATHEKASLREITQAFNGKLPTSRRPGAAGGGPKDIRKPTEPMEAGSPGHHSPRLEHKLKFPSRKAAVDLQNGVRPQIVINVDTDETDTHAVALPSDIRYAVHEDHTIAAQRTLLVKFGAAQGLTTAEANSLGLDELDTYLKKQTRARGIAGKKAAALLEKGELCGDGAVGKRVFALSARKDFQEFVQEELLELGLCPIASVDQRLVENRSLKIDFYMGEQFESPNAPTDFWATHLSPNFAKDSAIGAMPGLMTLFGSKQSYSVFYWSCKAKVKSKDGKANLCPKSWLHSFNVNGEEDPKKHKFKRRIVTPKDVEHLEQMHGILKAKRDAGEFPMVFIVKPQSGTYLSRGMHLARLNKKDVDSVDTFSKWIALNVNEKNCYQHSKYNELDIKCNRRKVTFQNYVMNPALVYGRKFDVRMWLLITSLDPLKVHVMRHGYPKVALRPFKYYKKLSDQCQHIRLLLDPYCNETTAKFLEPYKDGFPKSTASPIFFEGLSFRGMEMNAGAGLDADSWCAKESFWQSTVWPSIEEAFTSVLMLGRHSFQNAAKEAASKLAKQSPNAEQAPPHRRFALVSPDVTVDEEGQAYVEEINTNGMIMGSHARSGGYFDLYHDDEYLRGFLQIVGADDYPYASSYEAALDEAIAQFCMRYSKPCTPRLKRELALVVHEEAHAALHWYRLYPPMPCHKERHGHICQHDSEGSWWPEQARVTKDMRKAMGESDLDVGIRAFLQTTDTEAIHGQPMVPGHGRWYPRIYEGFYAP